MRHTPSNPNNPGHGKRGGSGASAQARRMLPLTVWLCSDHTTEPTRSHRPASGPAVTPRAASAPGATPNADICARHRQAVGHQLARHLISLCTREISLCTREGDVVAEGFTTSESTLVAAAELNRRAVAAVPHFPLAQHIGSRLRACLPEQQLNRVAMRPCRPDQMARGVADHLGQVGLVIAAPPPYETAAGTRTQAGERGCPACRADLWMLTREQLGAFLAAAWKILRPGGVLALITTTRHDNHRLIDPAPRIIGQAQGLGFRYAQHVIALRVPIDGDALMVQAGPTELAELRDARSRTLPPAASVHADVCLFLRPDGDAR